MQKPCHNYNLRFDLTYHQYLNESVVEIFMILIMQHTPNSILTWILTSYIVNWIVSCNLIRIVNCSSVLCVCLIKSHKMYFFFVHVFLFPWVMFHIRPKKHSAWERTPRNQNVHNLSLIMPISGCINCLSSFIIPLMQNVLQFGFKNCNI